MVGARGVALLGLSVIMTGIPDEMAYVAPVAWLLATGGVLVAIWMAWRVWRERKTPIGSEP